MKFKEYVNKIPDLLLSASNVLDLLTVGSTADPTYRDQWSDHDFWIIVANGSHSLVYVTAVCRLTTASDSSYCVAVW